MFILNAVDPDGVADGSYFPVQVLMIIFYPIQGFFNAFVYVRPRACNWKTQFPEGSWTWAFYKACISREPTPRRGTALRKFNHNPSPAAAVALVGMHPYTVNKYASTSTFDRRPGFLTSSDKVVGPENASQDTEAAQAAHVCVSVDSSVCIPILLDEGRSDGRQQGEDHQCSDQIRPFKGDSHQAGWEDIEDAEA